MKKLILLLLVVGCVAVNLNGQARRGTDANVQGHVIDVETKEHIALATVAVKGTTIGCVTDESGHFMMTNLPEGEHVLVAKFINYEPQEVTVVLVKNKTLEVNFELKEQPMMFDEVVVSSNRYETKKREAASVVNVVGPRLFEMTSAKTVAEVLPFQTGLRVETTCNNCGASELRINGLGGSYSQIMIDSRPVLSALAAVYGLDHYPAGMIDRIEVVRGGGSALFGSNAIAGVVNIITKDPETNSASISNETSYIGGQATENVTNVKASLVSSNNKTGLFVFGGHRSRSPYDRNGDGFTELTKMKNTNIGFRAFQKTSDYSKLVAEYHHIHEFRRGGDSLDLQPHETNITEQLEHHIDGGSVRFDVFTKNNKHYWTISSAVQHVARNSYYGSDHDMNAYGKTKEITSSSALQYRWNMQKCIFMPASLIAGAEYTYDKLEDMVPSYNRDIKQEVNVMSLFLQNEWKNKKLSLLLGARMDKHNMMEAPVLSPRLNVRYTPWKDWTFRASYSSGYRAPQVFDDELHVGAAGGEAQLIVNDAALKPEYSNSVNLSVDWYRRVSDNVQLNFMVEGFYTQLNDPFVTVANGYDADSNQIMLRKNATDKLTIAGANVEGRISYKNKLSLQLGYTYQQAKYGTPQEWSEDPDVETLTKLERSPDNYGYATFDWEIFDRFNATLSGVYTGSMLVPHFAGVIEKDVLHKSEGFFDMNLQVKYGVLISKTTKLDLKLGMKNILDSYQKDLDKGPLRDAGYIYGPYYPRTIFFGIGFSI